jgi:hypothetical protein
MQILLTLNNFSISHLDGIWGQKYWNENQDRPKQTDMHVTEVDEELHPNTDSTLGGNNYKLNS